MGSDSLVSARKIRQEIQSDDDIENAFDGITYEKGAAVLSMFEGWVGAPVFQRGVHDYLAAHAFAGGSSADLLAALSTTAGRDVATPFRTFLDQPGLPFVEASLSCEGKPRLKLRQSRYLPVGSAGDENRAWQVPVCARYADGKETRRACTLLTGREGELPLEAAACPAWVMPNADADGYYRWSLGAAEGRALAKDGYKKLSPRERLSFADSVRAGFARGKLPAGEALSVLAPFAADPSPSVATAPMDLVGTSARWLEKDPLVDAVRAYGRALYAPVYRDLGWAPKKGAAEDPGRALLRRNVIGFLAFQARDPEVRREAAARGRAYVGYGKDGRIHPEAVGADLAAAALAVAAEDGDAAFFDALVTLLGKEPRDLERRRILGALGSALRPELAARARDLCLDPRVHDNEATATLQAQLERAETRDAAWDWFKAHLDALLGRLNPRHASTIVWSGAVHCDRAHADELSALFTPRLSALDGLPRNLAGALEAIGLCAARREAQEPSVRAFFAKKGAKVRR
jgi:alanyl aminopeptidase